jgi:3',5'-cyclic AMP phosphodiesterase CpdA
MSGNPSRLAPPLALLALAACGPLHHAAVRTDLLDPATGLASPPLRRAEGDRLRVAVYGDAQGNRPVHRAVVAAILRERPDLVLFAGDAVDCLPAGHLPDYGGWQYLLPLWPQHVRDYPAVSLASVVPFPALIHEILLAPFAPPRDAGGYDGFLEDTAPLRAAGIPYLLAAGNHDSYHRADRETLARHFGPPQAATAGGSPASGALDPGAEPERTPDALWYAVDLAGWRFLVLDSGPDLLGGLDPMPAGGPQLAWLDARLSDATARGLRSVVVVHIPPFSSGREEGGAPWVSERLVEGVLDRHPVALVISGHVHAYERLERPGFQGRPVTFVVSGGGGGRFFHARAEHDPRSILFVEEVHHLVMLDLGPDGVDGRMVPVEVSGSPAVAGVASPSPSTTAPASAVGGASAGPAGTVAPSPGDRFRVDVR